MSRDLTLIHWSTQAEAHSCGYCKKSDGNISNGFWAESMTVEDYQDLIDRGWRRSGSYVYKPVMNQTCCPQYTIRCDALNFQLSKSQKKVIKRVNKYLNDGILTTNVAENKPEDADCVSESPSTLFQNLGVMKMLKNISNFEFSLDTMQESTESSSSVSEKVNDETFSSAGTSKQGSQTMEVDKKNIKEFRKGLGADTTKPLCKKAKTLRKERKLQKVSTKNSMESTSRPLKIDGNPCKSLKELLHESNVKAKHKLKVNLVSEGSGEWTMTKDLEYQVYKKYQTIVHNDKPESLSMKSFVRFLVDSPLINRSSDRPIDEDKPSFGSYHQQYWLDDKLIAVGVIDILPKCLSSVYFFYDPDYRNLIIGTYGSLREIDYVQRINKEIPSIEYYYMGFYIHSCQKMRYKGKLKPSFLLCPETYQWFPIESCLDLLDATPYARLNSDQNALDSGECSSVDDLNSLKIVADYRLVTYKTYRYDREQFKLLAKLIGKKCVHKVYVVPIND